MLSLTLLRGHGRLIAFGVLMCFCSSAGQTFFISLFGGEIRATFGLSHGEFGSIYSAGTLASAALLVWLGRLIDLMPLPVFAAGVLASLAAVCLFMGTVWGPGALLAAILGLRLFGQGLASHTGITAMARYFDTMRGRAVSIATLGHSAGDALLPALVVAALTVTDWRSVWFGTAIVLCVTLPLIFVLLKGQKERDHALKAQRAESGEAERDRALSGVLRDSGLWLRLPALLAPSFIFTGLIFHQVHLAASKGWPMAVMAGAFTVFAAASVATLLVAGPLVDRFTARRLVPYFLTPLALACLALTLGDAPLTAPVFMAFMGINMGLAFVITGSLWAELYGVTHLGAIRAFGQSIMVFSTGLAPAALGLLIDAGTSMETLAGGCALYCVAASGLALQAERRHRGRA